jgi:glyoxylase-like metal-dependent hydrolase (beta-lactamase superfamily II)
VSVELLAPGLYWLLLGRFQAYLWRDADGVTLIDTGAADAAHEVAAALDELGLGLADVDRIVLTHHHDDHAGAAAEIREWGGAQVIAHVADAPVITGAIEPPPLVLTAAQAALYDRLATGVPAAPPCPVDLEVRDGDRLDFAGGVQVIATPGHTEGSIALYAPAHGILFTGDTIGESVGTIVPGVFNCNAELVAESVRRLAEIEVDIAAFGHGEPVVGGASLRLREVVAAL